MEYITLNTGLELPVIGFGTMRVKNLEEMIPEAVRAGYRRFDTAANYDNEEAVGRGIRLAMRKFGLKREELLVTSKLQILTDGAHFTEASVDRSLKALGLDYLDIYLVHQPYGDVYGEWRVLEKLHKKGKLRAIGVANFEPFRLMDLILHNEVTPAVNQVELNPWYQQESERRFHEKHGIVMEAWSPLAQNRMNLFENELFKSLAAIYGKTVQQVILRWISQRGIAAVPRSGSPEHASANIDIFDFRLSDEEMEAIKTLDTGHATSLDHLDPNVVELLSCTVSNPLEGRYVKPDYTSWARLREEIAGQDPDVIVETLLNAFVRRDGTEQV